jgi:thiol reductant ABC exporter CydD subunit
MADPSLAPRGVAGRARGPFDPRLLRVSRGARGALAAAVVVACTAAVLTVVQAFVLADAITAAFQDGAGLAALRPEVIVLAAVVTGRAALAWVAEVLAQRAASRTSADLRQALLEHVVRLGPAWLSGQRRAEVATLATQGVDAVEPYVARFLPQLVVAVVVPIVVGVAVATQDLLSAVLLVVTVPLIPLFMALVGMHTRRATDRQWRTLSLLSGHFLDVVAGLPTLKAFGRARVQADVLATVDSGYRRATMRVLRISFLSSLVLELLSMLSVAVIAVSIGLRLLDGSMQLRTGLVVLILAPEVYLPIRSVGQQFHAAADGLSSAAALFDVLETPAPPTVAVGGTAPVDGALRPSGPGRALVVDGVSVTYPGRAGPALAPVSFALRPGRVTALTGPSGSGKSTLLAVLLGFLPPTLGQVRIGSDPLTHLDPDQWRRHLAWVGQDAFLLGPTVADDVRLGAPWATDEQVAGALRTAGLDPDDLRAGLATPVGDLTPGVSPGQRRRIVLARALLRQAPYVLLDEPTAALDLQTEAAVVRTVRRLADDGAAVLVVAHRPALVALADEVVAMSTDPVAVTP